MENPGGTSYGRIFRASAVLGSSSLVALVLGMARMKAVALVLGPGSFGTMGLYTSFLAIITVMADLGLGQSAVREVAMAAAKKDASELAQTVLALRRLVWVTGLIGLVFMASIAWAASGWTFGNHDHSGAFLALSVIVLFGHLTLGQTALLQGLRRVREIASISIAAAFVSGLVGVPIIYVFRQRGVVPFMISLAAVTLFVSWWHVRRLQLEQVRQEWSATWRRSKAMASLGFAVMLSSLAGVLSTFAIQLILRTRLGEVGVGLYQAAFTISGIYVGFVLNAMSTDYYPRLAGTIDDSKQMHRRVDEQAEMALLMAMPGLVACLVFSHWIIFSFYSVKFDAASLVLRWTVLGLFGRILSWPIGFIILAKSDRVTYFVTEVLAQASHVLLVMALTARCGLEGAGMAFAIYYGFHLLMIWCVGWYRYGFCWSASTARLAFAAALFIGIAFLSTFVRKPLSRYTLGMLALLASTVVSCAVLFQRLGRGHLRALLTRLLSRAGRGNSELVSSISQSSVSSTASIMETI